MYHVFGFVEFYVSPFIFAIGLIFLFDGVINYFFIGPSFEEDRRERGRQSLLWATFLFLIGLVAFSLAHWFFSLSSQIRESIDADVKTREDVLPVPNVPGRE